MKEKKLNKEERDKLQSVFNELEENKCKSFEFEEGKKKVITQCKGNPPMSEAVLSHVSYQKEKGYINDKEYKESMKVVKELKEKEKEEK